MKLKYYSYQLTKEPIAEYPLRGTGMLPLTEESLRLLRLEGKSEEDITKFVKEYEMLSNLKWAQAHAEYYNIMCSSFIDKFVIGLRLNSFLKRNGFEAVYGSCFMHYLDFFYEIPYVNNFETRVTIAIHSPDSYDPHFSHRLSIDVRESIGNLADWIKTCNLFRECGGLEKIAVNLK